MSAEAFDEEAYLIQALAPYCSAEAVQEGEAGWHTFLQDGVRVPVGVVNAYRDMVLAPAILLAERMDARVRRLEKAGAPEDEQELAIVDAWAASDELARTKDFYMQLRVKYEVQQPLPRGH